MSEAPSGKKLPVLKLVLAAGLVLVIGTVLLLSNDPRALIEQGRTLVGRALDAVRGAGPLAFFTAMAVFPAVGVPMLTFSLTVGSAFGPSLGMPMVVVWSLVAMAVNLTITYALARRGLRPVLEALVRRMGYKLPEVESGDVVDLIVILRVTPGIPFFVQNYLLGLAQVPAGRYFAVSCAIALPYCAAFVLFGNALMTGQGRLVLAAIGLLAALAAGTHMVRRHYSAKRRAAAKS
jgi:uncharacterized membrane protein YdjX (TVP38/TMEM64 family)